MSTTTEQPIACGEAIYTPGKNTRQCVPQLPLPGVVILVHGVNSDGEWYDATEQGLCAGLNARLARNPSQMAIPGVDGGQLHPVSYAPELDEGGFLSRDRTASTFIQDEPNYSPVIRFRWGYKADDKSLKKVGENIWLNEKNYWGGGPFANGCTSLPDLWTDGINDRLFLWLHAQDMNPEPGRDVYTCPPRHYYALAALRLAELVRLIRSKQADVPITIVCHSQGNMIGLAAAFYGAQLDAKHGQVEDGEARSGPSIADTYVLANPPYSLQSDGMFADNVSQRATRNEKGESGRQTREAREKTLAEFCKLIAQQQTKNQDEALFGPWTANQNPVDGSAPYEVKSDRATNAGKGRVTLYCNPHDRVISALTVRGIGWQGVSSGELGRVDPSKTVFFQRVWAQDHPVGPAGTYRYWHAGATEFWHPPSRAAKYNIEQAVTDQRKTILGRLFALLSAPITWFVVKLANTRINAVPDKNWEVPINAPPLPDDRWHMPVATRLGKATEFDQGNDPDYDYLKAASQEQVLDDDDPYDNFRDRQSPPTGDDSTEARLRYEHRARLRMQANGAGLDGTQAQQRDTSPNAEWVEWSCDRISVFLAESVDQQATDHSTIMTCAANSENVLAYDVAVGLSRINAQDWKDLRIAADWQLARSVKEENPLKKYGFYFESGLWTGRVPLHKHPDFALATLPAGIVDIRTNRPAPSTTGEYA